MKIVSLAVRIKWFFSDRIRGSWLSNMEQTDNILAMMNLSTSFHLSYPHHDLKRTLGLKQKLLHFYQSFKGFLTVLTDSKIIIFYIIKRKIKKNDIIAMLASC